MDTLTVPIWIFVASTGVYLFLRLVAAQIAISEKVLRHIEEREKKARKRRFQQRRDQEVIDAELAARGDAA